MHILPPPPLFSSLHDKLRLSFRHQRLPRRLRQL